MKINTVCLCGSTKFLDAFNEANVELTKRGLTVITISMALHQEGIAPGEKWALKEVLDLVHFNKILRADAVFVISDYIGFSTAREIIWANMQGKPVIIRDSGLTWDAVFRTISAGMNDDELVAQAHQRLKKISEGVDSDSPVTWAQRKEMLDSKWPFTGMKMSAKDLKRTMNKYRDIEWLLMPENIQKMHRQARDKYLHWKRNGEKRER